MKNEHKVYLVGGIVLAIIFGVGWWNNTKRNIQQLLNQNVEAAFVNGFQQGVVFGNIAYRTYQKMGVDELPVNQLIYTAALERRKEVFGEALPANAYPLIAAPSVVITNPVPAVEAIDPTNVPPVKVITPTNVPPVEVKKTKVK